MPSYDIDHNVVSANSSMYEKKKNTNWEEQNYLCERNFVNVLIIMGFFPNY